MQLNSCMENVGLRNPGVQSANGSIYNLVGKVKSYLYVTLGIAATADATYFITKVSVTKYPPSYLLRLKQVVIYAT